MKISFLFKYYIFAYLINSIISLRYPINKNLDNSTGQFSLIDIELRSIYNNYTKHNNVISIFHTNFCRYCYVLLDIFKWASSYSNVANWKFLSVNCTRKKLMCKDLNITKLPTIKTIVDREELPYEAPYELIPLLEYLIKLSTPSLINIIDNSTNTKMNMNMNKYNNPGINNFTMNISEFYKNYGYFSPLIEYHSNTTEFYNCIIDLANDKYRPTFYFGMKQLKNNKTEKEKIIFDNDGASFEYLWDGNCTHVDSFLNDHIFPLVTITDDNIFFYKLNRKHKLLVMLFGFLINNKTKSFVHNEYKFLAHKYNKYIFSFLNYTNTSVVNRYFKVKLYSKTELKLVIFDFSKSKYYVHPMVYDVDFNKPEEMIYDFNKILGNLSDVEFTTGYFFKDLLYKFGITEITTTFCFILSCLIIFVTTLIIVTCISFCKRVCPSEIGEDEKFEEKNENKETNNNELKKELENNNNKLKQE
jgi:hypothetical protein